jgi:hypothetical protein
MTTTFNNPLHDADGIVSNPNEPIYPGTGKWRKMLKTMIKRKKLDINDLVGLVADGTLEQEWVDADSKSDHVELKLLTYAFYMDTKNTVLQYKKFKAIQQKKSADEVLGVTILSSSYDTHGNPRTTTSKFVEGDVAYKIAMERMGDDVKFYEQMCRGLIAHDAFKAGARA